MTGLPPNKHSTFHTPPIQHEPAPSLPPSPTKPPLPPSPLHLSRKPKHHGNNNNNNNNPPPPRTRTAAHTNRRPHRRLERPVRRARTAHAERAADDGVRVYSGDGGVRGRDGATRGQGSVCRCVEGGRGGGLRGWYSQRRGGGGNGIWERFFFGGHAKGGGSNSTYIDT